MSEQTQEPTQEPAQISLQDIATVVQMIDVVSRRGAFEGNEMAGMGALRNKFEVFLRQNQPASAGEAPKEEVAAQHRDALLDNTDNVKN